MIRLFKYIAYLYKFIFKLIEKGDKMTQTASETTVKTNYIKYFKVLLHNDDRTSFDFVIYVLTNTFSKDAETAQRITREVHEKGIGLAGVYTQEVAELKLMQVDGLNKVNGFSLKVTMERDE